MNRAGRVIDYDISSVCLEDEDSLGRVVVGSFIDLVESAVCHVSGDLASSGWPEVIDSRLARDDSLPPGSWISPIAFELMPGIEVLIGEGKPLEILGGRGSPLVEGAPLAICSWASWPGRGDPIRPGC
jgi:hypothetical protein